MGGFDTLKVRRARIENAHLWLVRWCEGVLAREGTNTTGVLERLRSELYAVAESRQEFTSQKLLETSRAFDAVAIQLMKSREPSVRR
jgi:hypothetical protein